jgi:hypothetical protein
MLKIYKQITKIAFIAAILVIPAITHAGGTGTYGSGSWDGGWGWSDWGGNTDSYDTYYTPVYDYSSPSYGSNYGSSYGGSSYYPSYTPSYSGGSYGGSSIPSSTNVSNTNHNTSNSSSSANASSSNVNTNINNNNVYVYTNPTGNAVVYNPAHQNLSGYCEITPANPRTGQTVTATAYATGGIGNYTYTWGGDINQTTGVSTSFTSYTTGTKNIIVTIRSDQEVVTKSCNVTFVNDSYNNGLSATCFANPTFANINQTVTWRVNVSGGNGYNYSYNWSGTDGLSGSGDSISRAYGTTGTKQANVTVYANGQSVTTSCSTNIGGVNGSFTGSSINITGGVTSGTPVSGIFLGDLPATGLSLSFVDYMIGFMILILASVFTFVYQAKKRLTVENI